MAGNKAIFKRLLPLLRQEIDGGLSSCGGVGADSRPLRMKVDRQELNWMWKVRKEGRTILGFLTGVAKVD